MRSFIRYDLIFPKIARLACIRTPYFMAFLIMAISLVVVAMTTEKLTHTSDEAEHVAAGMQWWQEGHYDYNYDPKHPPLARALMAAPLYFMGLRNNDQRLENINVYTDDSIGNMRVGEELLQSGGLHDYMIRLGLIRSMLLPFYMLSMWIVFIWAKELYGEWPAVASLGLYATLPPILSHAGLAMTDMTYIATCMLALYLCMRWLSDPTISRSIMFGGAVALAVVSKFSSLVHIPCGIAALVAVNYYIEGRLITMKHLKTLPYALSVAMMLILLVYRCDIYPLLSGISALVDMNNKGAAQWLFGPLHGQSVWYFFPVLFFFKTPVPFLAVSAIAAYCILCGIDRKGSQVMAISLSIMLVSMMSHINIAIRHILILYPLLAIPAGNTLVWMMGTKNIRRPYVVGICVLALGWQCIDMVRYFPDYIPYFNVFAGDNPAKIAIVSNFDNDENLLLLKKVLNRRRINEAYVCFEGLHANHMPPAFFMPNKNFSPCPYEVMPGWTVVKKQSKAIFPEKFTWLDKLTPVETIDHTLELYFVP